MSTGTKVVQRALGHIGVHSPLQPASPEALDVGKDTLNSMLASWLDDWGIDMGTVPLNAIGDELSEPLGATNDIQYNLAMALKIDFPGAQFSPELKQAAAEGFQRILRTWSSPVIPKMIPRSTLPKGQGNKRGGNSRWDSTFFPEGSDLG